MAVVCEHDVLIGKFLVWWDVVAEGLGREAEAGMGVSAVVVIGEDDWVSIQGGRFTSLKGAEIRGWYSTG